jgi:uncharacterized protein YqgC (DUF456 family)
MGLVNLIPSTHFVWGGFEVYFFLLNEHSNWIFVFIMSYLFILNTCKKTQMKSIFYFP